MQELLTTLLAEAFDEIEQARMSVPRSITLAQTDQMIKVAIGMRRSGKTYVLYQKIIELLNQGIEKSRILFLDFEDDRLLPITTEKMAALIDSFFTLHPENHKQRCYLFLDEVQVVEDWHQVIRRIFKTKNIDLFITGSSAKLLSSEINTSLRGRSLATEVLPYSFDEYRLANQLTKPSPPFSKQIFDTELATLNNFFNTGGFPAVQKMTSYDWRATLQNYVDAVILKDIIERHNISNVALLKYLTKTLIINAASLFSVNKFFNDIKSQGYKISRETIIKYIDYLEDAFLIFKLPFYSESLRMQQNHSHKIYVIDNGLINAYSLKANELYSKFLENQIYLDLRRQGADVYYYKTKKGYEIDFVAVSKDGTRELIQVCWEMTDPNTIERETRALKAAEEELDIKGRIITAKDYAAAGLNMQ